MKITQVSSAPLVLLISLIITFSSCGDKVGEPVKTIHTTADYAIINNYS
ncbi:MAG: hypothetical protein ACI9WO_001195 [Sphingobacteriales bacterium]|jgi:hypothetical protein